MQSNQLLTRYMTMSKRKNRSKPGANNKKVSAKPLMSRRNAIKLLIATPVAGVTAAAIHRFDVQNKDLHDLSKIGEGTPTIVQIHDPSCPLCRRLMGNTRTALDGRDNVVYRVADVTTTEGKQFQQQYNVPNVTLLLFNGKGKLVDTVRGVTPVEELATRFAKL